jgi:hypothetical protein
MYKKKNISEVTDVCDKKKLLVHKTMMYIQFRTQRKIPDKSYLFTVNSKAVRVEYDTKLLGHFVDDQLNWNIHVNFLCSKLNTKHFMLFSARNKSSVESLLVMYNSFVYSDIINNIIFWGSNINHLSRGNLSVRKRYFKIARLILLKLLA